VASAMPGVSASNTSQGEILFIWLSFPQEDEVRHSFVIISSPARRIVNAAHRAKYSGALLCVSSFRCLRQLQITQLN